MPAFSLVSALWHALLRAVLAMLTVETLRLGIGLAHIRTGLGLAIPLVTLAVINLATGINPNQPRTATRSWSNRIGFGG